MKVNYFQLALIGFPFFNFSIFQFFNRLILLFFILHSLFFINVYSQHFLDQLKYNYNSTTNQLNYIKEAIGATISSVDLDNQNSNNYTYDANGRLVGDASEGILKIEWTSTDKVQQVSIDDDNNGIADRTLAFTYDAMGNRVKKTETFLTSWLSLSKPQLTTYYIYNAAGQLISIYKDEGSGAKCTEIEITDGSDNIASASIVSKTEFERKVGFKNYELKDHLGSVRVVVNDIKEPFSLKKIFKSNIQQSSDYYSYGMLMPGRSLIQAEGYRWGYQRKEKDDELKGNGNSYDFGARLLDPRVGRWLSIDPLAHEFPDKSPYNSMGNDPINKIDPDGRSEDNLTSEHSASYDSQHAFDDISPEAAEAMRQAWSFPVEMGLGFTPVGPVIDAKDIYKAYVAGSVVGIGVGVVSMLPFGELAKPALKGGSRIFRKSFVAGADLLRKSQIDPAAIFKVNNGMNQNSPFAALAMDRYLSSGNAWPSLEYQPTWDNLQIRLFWEQVGTQTSNTVRSAGDIHLVDNVLQEGDRVIIHGTRVDPVTGATVTGDVFNAVKINGKTVFMDPNLGNVFELDDIAGKKYSSFDFLITGKQGDNVK